MEKTKPPNGQKIPRILSPVVKIRSKCFLSYFDCSRRRFKGLYTLISKGHIFLLNKFLYPIFSVCVQVLHTSRYSFFTPKKSPHGQNICPLVNLLKFVLNLLFQKLQQDFQPSQRHFARFQNFNREKIMRYRPYRPKSPSQ